MTRLWIPRLAVLLLAASSAAGCKSKPEAADADRAPGSIVLVTIDTLRADHLGVYGYFRDTSPHIDDLAASSVRFARAVTPMATTLPAHVSMLTGTRPLRHGVVKNGLVFEPEPDLVSAAQMLKARGYATAAFVSASPLSKDSGVAAGFSHFDEPVGTDRLAEETVDRALAWLDAAKPEKFFLWVHLWDPHAPYEPVDAYRGRFEADDDLRAFLEERGMTSIQKLGTLRFDVEDIHDRYDAEIAYTDAQVGRFVKGLEARDLYAKSTLVLAADHGEGLWQHDWHDHGRIYNEQLFVPFMIKPPEGARVEPRVIEDLASTMDLVPTAFPVAGIALTPAEAEQVEGVDLLAERRPYVFAERVNRHRKRWEPGDKYAVITDRYKYFALSEGEDQLFDLKEDPHELVDVRAQRPEVAARLERQVQSVLTSYLARGPRTARKTANERLLKKLEALGYMQ